MNIREEVIKGFTHTYIENEEKIVRNLLQDGRLEEKEWEQIKDHLNHLKNKFQQKEITPEQYLQKRKQVREKLEKPQKTKKPGKTREQAEKTYRKIKEEQRKALKNAYIRSHYSTLRILQKTLSARISYTITQLKNI
ncbi:MAG: hypothetical protein ABEJ93_00590 [Candidatus Nanohalobium sp.]